MRGRGVEGVSQGGGGMRGRGDEGDEVEGVSQGGGDEGEGG